MMMIIVFGAIFYEAFCLPVLDSFKSKIINAGEIFELHFNKKLDLSLKYNNCSNIFDANTTAKLGSQPICRLFLENSIRLFPSQDAVLKFDDRLIFDNITISSKNSFFISNFKEASQEPFIKINGPNSNCRCPNTFSDNLKVNIDLSTLTGYAPLKNIEWHIYDNQNPNGKDLFAMELQVFHGLSEITIQSNWFTASQDYYIYVYGENVFGNTGNASKKIKFSDNCLPYVDIHLNSMYSDDDSTVLKSRVTYPYCSTQNRSFSPDWFLHDMHFPPSIDVFSDLLYIPQSELPKGRYVVLLRFTVCDVDNNEHIDSLIFKFNIELMSEVKIVGGDRTVGKFDTLNLNTALSRSTSLGSYYWRCLTESLACVQRRKHIVFSTYNYLEMNMQSSDLLPNSLFTIEVKYISNGLISTSSVNILVLQGNIPQVKIKAKRKKVSYSETIIFTADIENVKMSFNYTWSCSYKYDDTNEELNVENPTMLQVNSVDSRVPTIIKRFPPYFFDYGKIVVCKFSFLYRNQLIYANEEVEIVMPIMNAIIIASPQSGLAYEDKFRFRVTGWHQSNVYLFRFGIYEKFSKTAENEKVYKSMWSVQNWIDNVQFFMEKGDGPGNKLKIFYEIMDNEGFVTTITTDIVVNPFIAQNSVKIAKKVFDFAYYLQTDQLQCAEFLLDIIPLANLSNLKDNDPISVQINLVQYLAKFRRQGFIALLVTKAMDVIYKFVHATKGIMNRDTLNNITSTLHYISVNLLIVGQEIDSIKMTQQLMDISNILINNPGYLEILLSQTPSIIKGYLNVAGSNYDNQQANFPGSFISGLFILERFLCETSTSAITLNYNLKNKYGNWRCQNDYPFNCTGMLVVQAQYDYSLFSNKTFGEDWQPVSDVYELTLYNPATFEKLNTDEDVENFYEISLPLKYLELSDISNVQCQVWNPNRNIFDPTLCYYFAYMKDRRALCRCKRLGKIVVLYQEGAFPTTESAIIYPNLSYLFYFHMDFDPYCSTITRKKSITNKFTYQLLQYLYNQGLMVWPKLKLKIKRNRLVVVDCYYGGLGISTIEITVKDRYGELRSWFINQEIENMVANQTFKIQMKQGGDIALFDANQTTAKPVVTVPPIEEIKTNWMPAIIAIFVLTFFLLALAFGIHFHETKLLARNILTHVNINRPKELSELEKDKNAIKKQIVERFENMLLEGFVVSERSRLDKKVRPVSDPNATASGDSFYWRDSPMLDSSRCSSNCDSDSEDLFTSKITLIKAANLNKDVHPKNSMSLIESSNGV